MTGGKLVFQGSGRVTRKLILHFHSILRDCDIVSTLTMFPMTNCLEEI